MELKVEFAVKVEGELYNMVKIFKFHFIIIFINRYYNHNHKLDIFIDP